MEKETLGASRLIELLSEIVCARRTDIRNRVSLKVV